MWQMLAVCILCLMAGSFLGVLAMAMLIAGKCDRCMEEVIQRERARRSHEA